MGAPKITKLEFITYEYQVQDMGRDYNGFNQVYEKGAKAEDLRFIGTFFRRGGRWITAEEMAGDAMQDMFKEFE